MVDILDNCQRFLDTDDSDLEFYLNDLHDTVIIFPIQQEEVMFIKTATESLITTLCNNVISSTEFKIKKQGILKRNFVPFLKEKKEENDARNGQDRGRGKAEGKANAADISGQIQGNQPCGVSNNRESFPGTNRTDKRSTENKTENVDMDIPTGFKYRLLKVGSFYEGTKNIFPDEFDFIFLLGESYKRNECETVLLGTFHYMLQTLVKERYSKLPLLLSHDDFGCLILDEYCQAHGPASKLKFLYYRCIGQMYEIRTIYVDISPAYRLLQPCDVLHPRDFLFPEWYQPVVGYNLCLLTYSIHKSNQVELSSRVSITEYEHYFMMSIVSHRHRKVYQLVKYLINGDNLQEEVKAVCKKLSKKLPYYKERTCGVSSYAIKVIIFHHHYSCKNHSEDRLSPCVLDVLKDVHSCFHKEKRWVQRYFDFDPWHYNSSVWTMSTLRRPMDLIQSSDTKMAKMEKYLIEVIDNLQNMKDSARKNSDDDRKNLVPWSQYALDIHENTLRKLERRQTCLTVCCLLTIITIVIVFATLLALTEAN